MRIRVLYRVHRTKDLDHPEAIASLAGLPTSRTVTVLERVAAWRNFEVLDDSLDHREGVKYLTGEDLQDLASGVSVTLSRIEEEQYPLAAIRMRTTEESIKGDGVEENLRRTLRVLAGQNGAEYITEVIE